MAILEAVMGIIMKALTDLNFFEVMFFRCFFMIIFNYYLIKMSDESCFDVKNTPILILLVIRVFIGFSCSLIHNYSYTIYKIGDVLVFLQLSSIFVGIFGYIM